MNHGVYIHVPFCLKKCAYCDFYSLTDLSLRRPFVDSLLQEMNRVDKPGDVTDTLYFGGGTPSVLSRSQIQRLCRQACEQFRIASGSEITVETNPGTVSADYLSFLKRIGVNRINIGIQSFAADALGLLGRVHDPRQAIQAIQDARRAGFENVGLDLIFGIPGQTRADWRADLNTALSFFPEHLACYMLTMEPGTLLARRMQTGRLQPLCERDLADLFRDTQYILGTAGYEQYEISNYARLSKGKECWRSRHNRKYWSFAPYTGLGPSAHSYRPPVRHWNVRQLHRYVQLLFRNQPPRQASEETTPAQQMTEAIYLGLRTADGIDTAQFEKRFNLDFNRIFGEVLQELGDRSLVIQEKGRCAPTPKGMLFHETVVSRLLESIP